MATKMCDGRGLIQRNINAKHGAVMMCICEIAVNNKRHLILLLSMQCILSVLRLLPCTIHHAIMSIKTMSVSNSTSYSEYNS